MSLKTIGKNQKRFIQHIFDGGNDFRVFDKEINFVPEQLSREIVESELWKYDYAKLVCNTDTGECTVRVDRGLWYKFNVDNSVFGGAKQPSSQCRTDDGSLVTVTTSDLDSVNRALVIRRTPILVPEAIVMLEEGWYDALVRHLNEYPDEPDDIIFYLWNVIYLDKGLMNDVQVLALSGDGASFAAKVFHGAKPKNVQNVEFAGRWYSPKHDIGSSGLDGVVFWSRQERIKFANELTKIAREELKGRNIQVWVSYQDSNYQQMRGKW